MRAELLSCFMVECLSPQTGTTMRPRGVSQFRPQTWHCARGGEPACGRAGTPRRCRGHPCSECERLPPALPAMVEPLPRSSFALLAELPGMASGARWRTDHDGGASATKKGTRFFNLVPRILVRLAGIEPTTPWFVAKYSIQLSYSRPMHAL
jgi:hypothetical protein